MQKDTHWFPHDLEPTSDPKIQAMLSDYGGFGYGMFWRITEMLHSDPLHKLPFKKFIYQAIAKQMQANAKQKTILLNMIEITSSDIELFIQDCIIDYELFEKDDLFFWSNRCLRNIEKKQNISISRSESGKHGAIAKQKLAKAKQTQAIRGDKIREDDNIKKDISLVKIESDVQKNKPVNFRAQPEELLLRRIKEGESKVDSNRQKDN